jgi:hypothetical protein
VLDGIFAYCHALFAAVILQAAQPVTATAEVVEITGLQIAVELFVFGKSAVGRQPQEVCLNALVITVLP